MRNYKKKPLNRAALLFTREDFQNEENDYL